MDQWEPPLLEHRPERPIWGTAGGPSSPHLFPLGYPVRNDGGQRGRSTACAPSATVGGAPRGEGGADGPHKLRATVMRLRGLRPMWTRSVLWRSHPHVHPLVLANTGLWPRALVHPPPTPVPDAQSSQ